MDFSEKEIEEDDYYHDSEADEERVPHHLVENEEYQSQLDGHEKNPLEVLESLRDCSNISLDQVDHIACSEVLVRI